MHPDLSGMCPANFDFISELSVESVAEIKANTSISLNIPYDFGVLLRLAIQAAQVQDASDQIQPKGKCSSPIHDGALAPGRISGRLGCPARRS